MPKRHILVDPTQQSTSKRTKPPTSTNWDICVLCQEDTGEPLQCPLRAKRQSKVGTGYSSLAENLLQFQTLQHVPLDINLECLDDGGGIESTLMVHQAKWHKKCQLQFNKKAFDEQCRRESTVTVQQGSPSVMHTRSVKSHPSSTEPTCFFCDKPAGLHNASTYNIDTNVRRCALEL